ncbi:MAG TPA: hypothetical protein VMB21_02990 [Candidatus Limnocylindria bacterium]|nr:hypothetical protein [Candidatus Limnocylindria bacterium]
MQQLRGHWHPRSSGWKLRAAGGALASLAAGSLLPLRAQSFFNPYTAPLPNLGSPLPDSQGAGDNYLINRGVPYNPTGSAAPHDYNMKLGPVTASVTGGTSFSYYDNYNLVPEGSGLKQEDELAINPTLGIAFQWPIRRDSTLHFDVGVGYAVYLNHPDQDRFTISPNSAWDYQFKVGDVRITVADHIGTTGDSSSTRTDLSGTGSASAVDFRRLANTFSLSAAWQPTRRYTVSAGYALDFDHGLGDSFGFADHLTHTMSTAVFRRLDSHWTVGLSASAFRNEYLQDLQNSSTGYGAGPTLTWQPSPFLNFSGSVRYNTAKSDGNGTLGGANSSSGAGYDFSVQHIINRHLTHGLSISSGIDLGVGVNFNQTQTISYRMGWQITKAMNLAFSASRQETSQSSAAYDFFSPPPGSSLSLDQNNQLVLKGPDGQVIRTLPDGTFPNGNLLFIPRPAETAESYTFGLGTSFQITRRLNASVGYLHTLRLSNLPLHDYNQNTYTLSLGYRF